MIKKILILSFIVALLIPSISTFAINATDLQSLYGSSEYYWPNQNCQSSSSSSGTGTLTSGASVYILGDSITDRAQSAYTAGFQAKGITANIDASSGRSLNGGGTDGNQLSGMAAIAADTANIKSAGAIVVALGSNGGDTNVSIDAAIKALRADNPSAPIYWVDTIGVNGQNFNASANKNTNVAIYSEASADNYQVISWFKTVDPSGDPQNPSTPEKDPSGYIDNSDGLGVHPTPAGVTALVNLVVGAVVGGSAASSGGACTCGTPSGTSDASLSGKDNVQKAYNYFIGKGLTPVQSAAILGNLMQESGVDPQEIQGGGETMDPNAAGSGGWGIAQWTPGSNIIGIAQSLNITGPIYDLSTQLDIIWGEMGTTTPPGVRDFIANFKTITDLATATSDFTTNFEAAGIIGPRLQNAQQVLQQYGGNASPGTSTSGTASGCGSASVNCGGSQATGNAAIACDALKYDPVSYSENYPWHSDGKTWHAACPTIGPSCAIDCSGLVSVAIYDVFHNDNVWSTYTMVSDTANFKQISASQLAPGDFIEPAAEAGGHVVIVEQPPQGNNVQTFAANESGLPQPEQVNAGTYTLTSGDIYLRYVGQGSTAN